jgi:lysophospholipase L1-like esterase
MVTAIRSAGAQVILVGVPAPGFTLQPPALYQRLAEEAQIPVAMEILPEILSDRSLKNDPVHPNSAGYERLALRLAAILRDAGGLPPKP